MAAEVVERELKFDVDDAFTVPDIAGLVGDGRLERGTTALDSVYFDTDARDLLAAGVTVRCRTGTTDNGWQLKIPTGDARTEVRLEPTDNDSVVPEELAALVLGARRGRSLKHLVTVQTNRSTERLLTAGGELIVEIADDRVHAAAPGPGSATVSQWREIEAELGPAGTEEHLEAVAARMVKAGAHPSASGTKVARALAAPTNQPDRPDRGGGSGPRTAGEVITAYLAEQDRALIAGDLNLRRGLGGIHPTRVATRRLRSTLRIFADYLDPDAARALDAELAWYAELLGQVRDREVQRDRFAAVVADLPVELVLGPVAATIEQHLLGEQIEHHKALLEAMNGRRYLALLGDVQRLVQSPPLTDRAADKATSLRAAVQDAEKKVREHLAAALAGNDDEELHKARKAGKRARYAAELAAPVLGGKVKKRIKRYQELQDILGDFQDGVVAAALLRRLASGTAQHTNENGFTYGLLYAQEQRRADHGRQLARQWTP